MELKVLGPLVAIEGGKPLPLGGLKQRTVLALLVAHGGRPVSTDALIYGVYGDHVADGARRSLQTYVSNLRRQLGDYLHSSGSGYVLAIDRSAVDAFAFEDVVLNDDETDEPATRAQRLREALGMWRGHAYADVDGFDVIPGEITRLHELRLAAVEKRVDADLRSGRHSDLVGELEQLTEEHPHRERLRGQQMLALYRSGRQADALRSYRKARTYLIEELGLDPSVELRTLESQILEQDPELGHQPPPSIRRVTVLVADLDDPAALATIEPADRSLRIDRNTEVLADAITAHNGRVFAQRGTSTYSWFDSAPDAVAAAAETQWALADFDDPAFRIRMAVDTGDVELVGSSGVVGPPVSRAAALVGGARGGQVLLAKSAHAELANRGGEWQIRGLGTPAIEGVEDDMPVHLLQGAWPGGDVAALREHVLLPAPPERTPGMPGYESREVAGTGDFGVVYRAYQPSVGREVAVKEIRPDLVDHPLFIRRFEVEAQLVARLEHPHIVPLYDFWRDATGAFLVTRWMRGGTLQDRIQRGQLGVPDASQVLAQIGSALATAHRNGVTHRDIRPENILFDESGNAYLTDFAIASVNLGEGSASGDVHALADLLVKCLGRDALDKDSDLASLIDRARSEEMSVEALLVGWDQAVGGVTHSAASLTEARNPYKGLNAFSELDAADFHGRDALVRQLVEAVEQRRMVGVVGPSGIGKSSVVRAGLVPAVRGGVLTGSERWLVTDMVPTAYPFEQLASALERVSMRTPADFEDRLRKDRRGLLRATQRYLPKGATLLLVIDQFEELFTLTTDEAVRSAFLELLAESATDPRSPIRIVLTIRADFFDRPLRYARFGELLRTGTVPVSAPTDVELRKIIEMPAHAVDVSFDRALVDRIMSDVGDQPGTLPLLEFALTRLFDHRSSDVITSGDYDRIGGVPAALGRQAEAVFGAFDDLGQEVARQVFMRLVNTNESGRSTRRRTRLTELGRLGYSPNELDSVVDPLVEARLLTLDRDPITRGPTVEVAHEALLSEWSRLAGWIDEYREDLLLHSRLAVAVADWETSERNDTYLLRAGRLDQHEAWSADTELSLTTTEHEFLGLSRRTEDDRRAQRRRVRRRVLAGFGAAAVLASVLAVAALVARNDAADRENLARARELANASSLALAEDPELGVLLAIEAASHDLPSAATALHQALFEHRTDVRFSIPEQTVGTQGALSPDGRWLAAGESKIWAWDLSAAGNETAWVFNPQVSGLSLRAVGFDADSESVVVAATFDNPAAEPSAEVREAMGLYVVSATNGSVVGFHAFPDLGRCAAIRVAQTPDTIDLSRPVALFVPADGPLEGAACDSTVGADPVYVWDLAMDEYEQVGTIALPNLGSGNVTLSGDGSRIGIGGETTQVIDVATKTIVFEFPESPGQAVLNQDGSRLLAGFGRPGYSDLRIYDVASGNPLTTFFTENEVFYAGFGRDESVVVTAGFDSSIRIFDAETGLEIMRLLGPANFAKDFSMDATGTVLAGFVDSSDIRIWDIGDVRAEIERLEIDSPQPFFNYRLGTDAENGTISIRHLGGVEVFSAETLDPIVLHAEVEGQDAALSPGGNLLAVQSMSPDPVAVPSDVRLAVGVDTSYVVGTVRVIDAVSGGLVSSFEGLCAMYAHGTEPVGIDDCAGPPGFPHPDVNYQLAFSPDEAMVVMEGYRYGYIVWEVAGGTIVYSQEPPPTHLPWNLSPTWSPQGDQLVVGDKASDVDNFKLLVLDTTSWATIAEIDVPLNWDIAEYTPDGRQLLVGFQDGRLRFYDTTTWTELGEPIEAQGFISSMTLTADGERVAIADGLGNVTIYDIESRAALEELRYGTRIQDLAFIHEDRHLLLTPRYASPFVIAADAGEALQIARSRLTRSFSAEECATYGLDPCPTLEDISAGS